MKRPVDTTRRPGPASRWVFLALALLLVGAGAARAEELVVIVNDKAPVQSVTAKDVKEIFLGEITFWGDLKIVPVGYVDGAAVETDFLERVVRVTENVYKTYWIKRIFREGGTPPRKVGSAAEALTAVARTPGGIGFVYASELAGATGVREVLRVPD
jgi:ABC-type phosphate transport system substrate-binding protein